MSASPKQMPTKVLFVCNRNALRSPMAAALAGQFFGRRLASDSVGVEAGELDPFAAEVMAEAGIDIRRYTPKAFDLIDINDFELIVTLTPEAHHHALDLARAGKVPVEYWPTVDPTLVIELGHPRERILDAYRDVREALKAKVLERFSTGTLADV